MTTPKMEVKFVIKLSFCDCSDVYILVEGTITITGHGDYDPGKRADKRYKGVMLKSWIQFR